MLVHESIYIVAHFPKEAHEKYEKCTQRENIENDGDSQGDSEVEDLAIFGLEGV